jgi:hypothetical protein
MFVIVPRRVQRTGIEIFVGAFSSLTAPPPLVLVLDDGGRRISVGPWRAIDGGRSEPIFWWSGRMDGLESNRRYELTLVKGAYRIAGATFETLPENLPLGDTGSGSTRPFTLWLSSCYSVRQSPSGLGTILTRVLDDARLRPHVKCLVGDQVYLDELSLFIYTALTATRLRSRFNQQYARTWTHPDFSRLLSTNASFFLPDDHELWNNYPDPPFGVPLRGEAFWRLWYRLAFVERCLPIQAPRRTETVNVGRDLSIFIADARTERTRSGDRFMTESEYDSGQGPGSIDQLTAWLEGLRCPGVLVLQQPVVTTRGSERDRKLPDYRQYWRRLLPALHACRQDVVILGGDSHNGLVGTLDLGGRHNPHRVIQIVSSPLSLVNPIAASTGRERPDYFPGVSSQDDAVRVDYPLLVPSYRRGPVARTEEHAMTIAFWRRDAHTLGMRVRTWLVRGSTQNVGPTWETTLRAELQPRSAELTYS